MSTDLEVSMTIKTLARKGIPKRDTARQLEMSEGNVRDRLRRVSVEATDGRTHQRLKAADWGEQVTLQAFQLTLSNSRYPTIIWARGQDQLSWPWCHDRAFERPGGIPGVVRVDNIRTAVGQDADPWGEINAALPN